MNEKQEKKLALISFIFAILLYSAFCLCIQILLECEGIKHFKGGVHSIEAKKGTTSCPLHVVSCVGNFQCL